MLTSIDICRKAKELASEKTLYVKGGHGNYLNQKNKLRFSNNDIYNIKRTNIIFAADEGTRAWDEFGFLAAVSGYNCRAIGEHRETLYLLCIRQLQVILMILFLFLAI